jgi:hypothetical protein
MDDEDLTESERRALRDLPSEAVVPPALEDRVVESLRRRGLLARRAPWLGAIGLWRAAAAVVIFAAGTGTGLLAERSRTATSPAGPASPSAGALYLLLLYSGPTFEEGSADDEAARVAEYGAWAGSLAHEGRLVHAEKLEPEPRVIGDAPSRILAAPPQGFFLVRARDLADAQAIARACPHIRHGGQVAVHAIAPTS